MSAWAPGALWCSRLVAGRLPIRNGGGEAFSDERRECHLEGSPPLEGPPPLASPGPRACLSRPSSLLHSCRQSLLPLSLSLPVPSPCVPSLSVPSPTLSSPGAALSRHPQLPAATPCALPLRGSLESDSFRTLQTTWGWGVGQAVSDRRAGVGGKSWGLGLEGGQALALAPVLGPCAEGDSGVDFCPPGRGITLTGALVRVLLGVYPPTPLHPYTHPAPCRHRCQAQGLRGHSLPSSPPIPQQEESSALVRAANPWRPQAWTRMAPLPHLLSPLPLYPQWPDGGRTGQRPSELLAHLGVKIPVLWSLSSLLPLPATAAGGWEHTPRPAAIGTCD